jgi:hypothetical protein
MELFPLPTGVTSVVAARLYSDEDRTAGELTLPATLDGTRWTVDTLNVPDGRWWATVDAQKGADAYSYPLRDPIDLPEDDRLIVSPETLGDSIGMPLPLSPAQRKTLTQAILDAQDDVVGYLGQPLMPQQFVQTGVWAWGDEWPLTAHGDIPVSRILSTVPETDVLGGPGDTWTITYLAGINARDGAEYSPIRRFVRLHAANSGDVTRLWRSVVNPEKVIKSSSTSGQSVSYEVPTLGGGGAAGSGIPGALPTRTSLDHWRIAGRRVHQGPTRYGTRYGV